MTDSASPQPDELLYFGNRIPFLQSIGVQPNELRLEDGLSMIYSFFAADSESRPGLGNFIIMDHIMRARAAGLPYVYLGYWVKGSERMAYKTRYRPIEVLKPGGWVRMNHGE